MAFNLSQVKKNEVALVIIPSSAYKKKEMSLVKALSKKYGAICYVNINRPFGSLIKEMQSNKIKEENFFFIDTTTAKSATEHERCIYLESPSALTNLSIMIKKTLNTKKFDAILFDSLSSLLTFHNVDTLTKFIHDLFSVVKKAGVAAIFTMQAGTNENLTSDIGMFADHVIEVS
jgi:archaellum biogenesis ATPase FlaH